MTAALILAGGEIKPEQRGAWAGLLPPGVFNRARIEIAGRPMLEYVVDAVRGATDGPVLVAGDVPMPAGCQAAPGGETMIDTLLRGAAALPEARRLLVATADIPFLTADAVRDLLERAAAFPDAAFLYPIVEAARCRERFPQMKRTTLRLAEGAFTGGNVVVVDPRFLREREAVLRAAYAARKDVPRLAALLGAETIGRLLLSRLFPAALTIPRLEAAVSRVLGGVPVRALRTPYPEIGADIDHPEDVAIARRMLAGNEEPV